MTSGLGNRRHQELPDLFGQRAQLRLAERAYVRRTRDPVEYRCTGNLVHIPLFESSEEPAVPPTRCNGRSDGLVSAPALLFTRSAVYTPKHYGWAVSREDDPMET